MHEYSGGKSQKNRGGKTYNIRLFPHFRAKNYKNAIQILENQAKIKNRRDKCPFCLHVRPPLCSMLETYKYVAKIS